MTSAVPSLATYVSTIAKLKMSAFPPAECEVPLAEASVLADTCLESLFTSFDKINKTHKFKGDLGFCYKTAYHIAAEDPDYIYCEGYATSEQLNIPLLHAWCVHRKSKEVYDGVWNTKKTSGNAYCGLPLNLDFVTDFILSTKRYGVIDNLWSQKEFLSLPIRDIVHPEFHNIIL